MMNPLSAVVVVVSFLSAPPVPNAELAERLLREAGDIPVTIVYDVRDLTARINDAVPAVETGLTGGASLEKTAVIRPTVEDVVDRITSEIEPASWGRTRGEGGATIQQLDGNLIVTALPEIHDAIQVMLATIRERFALNVVIDLCFIDEGDVPVDVALLRNVQPGSDSGARLAGAASADAFESIQREIDQSRDPAAVLARPRLLVLDGQSASVVVSSMTPYDLPVAGLAPRTNTVRPLDGVAVWLRPRVSDDRTSIRLAIEPRVARLEPGPDLHEHAAHAEVIETIDDGQTLVVRMPVTTTHLAGVRVAGSAVEAFLREPCPQPAPVRTVLVLVRARVISAVE